MASIRAMANAGFVPRPQVACSFGAAAVVTKTTENYNNRHNFSSQREDQRVRARLGECGQLMAAGHGRGSDSFTFVPLMSFLINYEIF